MSFKAPKLPPPPAVTPPPSVEDEASRAAREREVRRAGRGGRRSLSLTAMAGAATPGMSPTLSLTPGRNTVTGG